MEVTRNDPYKQLPRTRIALQEIPQQGSQQELQIINLETFEYSKKTVQRNCKETIRARFCDGFKSHGPNVVAAVHFKMC